MNEQGILKKKFNSEKAVFSSGIPEDVCPRLTPMQIKHCKKKKQKKKYFKRVLFLPSSYPSLYVLHMYIHPIPPLLSISKPPKLTHRHPGYTHFFFWIHVSRVNAAHNRQR